MKQKAKIVLDAKGRAILTPVGNKVENLLPEGKWLTGPIGVKRALEQALAQGRRAMVFTAHKNGQVAGQLEPGALGFEVAEDGNKIRFSTEQVDKVILFAKYNTCEIYLNTGWVGDSVASNPSWVQDEAKWTSARKAALKDRGEDHPLYWQLVSSIYQKEGGRIRPGMDAWIGGGVQAVDSVIAAINEDETMYRKIEQADTFLQGFQAAEIRIYTPAHVATTKKLVFHPRLLVREDTISLFQTQGKETLLPVWTSILDPKQEGYDPIGAIYQDGSRVHIRTAGGMQVWIRVSFPWERPSTGDSIKSGVDSQVGATFESDTVEYFGDQPYLNGVPLE